MSVDTDQSGSRGEPPFAPLVVDEEGKPQVCCEQCGSTDLDFDGWDIDKCRSCGHWRYR